MARAAVSKTAGREFEPHRSCHFLYLENKDYWGKKMEKVLTGIRNFITDTLAELKKCSWPTQRELFESTILVIVAILIFTAFIYGVDKLFQFLSRLITG